MAESIGSTADAEFGTVAGWTTAVARDLGAEYHEAAGCRGSGSPIWLDWLADRLDLTPGEKMLDVGAGLGGPSAYAGRTRGVRPVLIEAQPTACLAAQTLFGLPSCCAVAGTLPIRTAAVRALWCLGVLCTLPETSDQQGLLRELRRVIRPSGRIGLLVLIARQADIPNGPIGNNFPTGDELDGMIVEAGFRIVDAVDTAELPPAPKEWTDRGQLVEHELRRRYGWTEGWRIAMDQSERIGALLREEIISTRLAVATPI